MLKSRYFWILVCAFSVAACSGKDEGARGVAGKMRIAQLGSGEVTLASTSTWGDAPDASGQTDAYAKVDGIKIQLTELFGESGGRQQNFAEFSPAQTLTITSGDSAIKLTGDIAVPEGSYERLGVRFKNSYSLKAFCHTSGKKLYTTTEGIKECAGCGDGDALPNDYDYYDYSFMQTEDRDDVIETIPFNFEVNESDTPNITLLIDTSYIVSCTERTAAEIDAAPGSGLLPPFSWQPADEGKFADWFTNSEDKGLFGVGYIPIFTYASNTGTETIPEGQTYAAWADSVVTKDLTNAFLTTITFLENGDILAARSRSSGHHNHETQLEQGWSGYVTNGATYTMQNGEHWGPEDGNFSDPRWLQDRKITGFQRTAIGASQAIKVSNGDDCGRELSDRNQTCLAAGSEIDTTWIRIAR